MKTGRVARLSWNTEIDRGRLATRLGENSLSHVLERESLPRAARWQVRSLTREWIPARESARWESRTSVDGNLAPASRCGVRPSEEFCTAVGRLLHDDNAVTVAGLMRRQPPFVQHVPEPVVDDGTESAAIGDADDDAVFT